VALCIISAEFTVQKVNKKDVILLEQLNQSCMRKQTSAVTDVWLDDNISFPGTGRVFYLPQTCLNQLWIYSVSCPVCDDI
jgi:hypothetical protein